MQLSRLQQPSDAKKGAAVDAALDAATVDFAHAFSLSPGFGNGPVARLLTKLASIRRTSPARSDNIAADHDNLKSPALTSIAGYLTCLAWHE